jgi:hypothetical protein
MNEQDGRKKDLTFTRGRLILTLGLASFAGFTIGYMTHGFKVWSQIIT